MSSAVPNPGSTPQSPAERALHIVGEIADRLRDPEYARSIGAHERNAIDLEGRSLVPWGDTGLSHGYPGMALLYAELDRNFPDAGWDKVALAYFKAMQPALEESGFSVISLFSGTAGLAFSVLAASREQTRYTGLLRTLDQHLLTALPAFLDEARDNASSGAVMQCYDVIEGVSGIGRYLLHRANESEHMAQLQKVLDYLVSLTGAIEIDGHTVPAWYVSVERQYLESDRRTFPHGNFNCGLAHGICGPLALLSLATLSRVTVNGQRAAIERVAEWLLRHRQHDRYGTYWRSHVDWFDEIQPGRPMPPEAIFHRAAWCYGTPGVARSLWLAGAALQRETYQRVAVSALLDCLQRPVKTWNISGPTFCHGASGLLHITRRMLLDSGDQRLAPHVKRLKEMVLTAFDPTTPLGYQDIEELGGHVRLTDKPGLLDGAVGPALVLLGLHATCPPIWDSAFLLA